MKKRLSLLIILTVVLLPGLSSAQDTLPLYNAPKCDFNAAQQWKMGVFAPGVGATAGITLPASFPAGAIETCGKFKIYYEDLRLTTGGGFSDPTWGATRRNTLCAVLNYMQSVFNFSSVPAGQYIRLHVDTSYYALRHAPPSLTPLGEAYAYYKTPVTAGDIVNGFVNNYMRSGVDPMPGDYHAELQMNFDSLTHSPRFKSLIYTGFNEDAGTAYNNGLDTVGSCQYDLYSTLLHFMSHTLGYFSWQFKSDGAPIMIKSIFTSMDTGSYYSGHYTAPDPFSTMTKVVVGGVWTLPSSTTQWGPWANKRRCPHNYAAQTHAQKWRISSGDEWSTMVMRGAHVTGLMERKYCKEELETFVGSIGLSYNPTYATTNAALLANNIPYCNRMCIGRYNHLFERDGYGQDTLPSQFIISNNIGTKLAIPLTWDTSIHDEDGDHLTVFPGSLVNFRGCGEGGNNHNSLTLNATRDTIFYTPRHNFYGRAQFGFNLYDSVEKGAFVLFTIDVRKGTNVTATFGSNLVVNGDLEEGSEIKLIGNVKVNNSNASEDSWGGSVPGRIRQGLTFTDGMIWTREGVGSFIRNSYVECNELTAKGTTFGSILYYFPLSYGGSLRPNPPGDIGNRYIPNPHDLRPWNHFRLIDSVRNCGRYTLEFDAMAGDIRFGMTDTFRVFLSQATTIPPPSITGIGPGPSTVLYSSAPIIRDDLHTGATWRHITLPFSYCNANPADALTIYVGKEISGVYQPVMLLDNIKLTQKSLEVLATDTLKMPCIHHLAANANVSNGCGGSLNYVWTLLGGDTIGHDRTVDVSPAIGSSYVVTVWDDCGSVSDTIAVNGGDCPCSPGKVFGDTVGFQMLAGTITAQPAASAYYYISSDITLNRSINLKNANVLIEPNVRINVSDTVLFTLDSAHLFTCDSTKIWKGIYLQSGSLRSGRITLKNNSMIEDADTAIRALSARWFTGDTVINCRSTTFNRNRISIYIVNFGYATGPYPFHVSGSVFTSRRFKNIFLGYPIKWPAASWLRQSIPMLATEAAYNLTRHHSYLPTKVGAEPVAGIWLSGVGNTNVAGTVFNEIILGDSVGDGKHNLFDKHRHGIYSLNSNLRCFNSHFVNIFEAPSPFPWPFKPEFSWGSGIYSTSTPGSKFRLMAVPNQTRINRFHDCVKGVTIESMFKAEVRTSTMTSSHTLNNTTPGAYYTGDFYKGHAIHAKADKTNSSYIFRDNKISNIHNGIFVFYDAPMSGNFVDASDNSFWDKNPEASSFFTAGQYMACCISANMAMDGPGNSTLDIKDNETFNVNTGIFTSVYGRLKVTADNNIVRLYNNPDWWVDQYGVAMVNTSNAIMSRNQVSSTALTGEHIHGVYSSFTTNTRICDNNEENIGRGFEFAQTTPQAGTKWYNNTMKNSWKGMLLASDIGTQIYMRDAFTPWLTFFANGTNKWIGTWPGTNYNTFADGGIKSSNSKLYVRNITSSPAEMPANNFAAPFVNRYLFSGTTGSLLLTQQTASCDGLFYPSASDGPTKPKPLFGLIIADSLGYGDEFKPNQWMAQLGQYEQGIIDPQLKDSSTDFATFMTQANTSRFKWISDIQKFLEIGDMVSANSLLNSLPQAMGRVVINGNVIITDYSEANHVFSNYVNYFTLYRNYFQGTLSSNDTVVLKNLAQKCPALHGAVVYKARALYKQVSKEEVFYKDDSCTTLNNDLFKASRPSDQQPMLAFTLYPNPNNGSFVIRQNLAKEELVVVKLYNSLGMLVEEREGVFRNGLLNFNTTNKLPGLYLVCITDRQNHTVCLKFNLQ